MRNRKIFIIQLILLMGMGVFLFIFRDYLNYAFLRFDYSFESVSEGYVSEDGDKYFIDNGSTKLIKVDKEDRIVRCYSGGNESSDFYYAQHVCEGADGSIYVADIMYGDHGNRVEKENIYQIRGHSKSCVVSYDYTSEENPPLQYGNILELRYEDGKLFYVYKVAEDRAEVTQIREKGKKGVVRSVQVLPENGIKDASYDISKDRMIVSDRRGNVYYTKAGQDELQPVERTCENGLIQDVYAGKEGLFFLDSSQQSIYKIEDQKAISVYSDSNVYYQFCVANGDIYATDFVCISQIAENAKAPERVYDSLGFAYPFLHILYWMISIIVILNGIALLIWLIVGIRGLLKQNENGEMGLRMLVVSVSCLLVAFFVTYSMMQSVITDKKSGLMEDMEMFSSLMSLAIDSQTVSNIHSIKDYNSKEYVTLKDTLDHMIEESYDVEKYYYYDILVPNEEMQTFDVIMDYENAYLCTTPVYTMEDNEYLQSFTTGEMVTIDGGLSSYGSWSYCLNPIRSAKGEIIALLEVGMNFAHVQKIIKQFVVDTILDVFCSSAVITMLVLEIMFLTGFYDTKRNGSKQYIGIEVPIRMLVFLVYMADSMQDGFVAILCSRLYAESTLSWVHMLPKGIAVAFPLSAQLFVSAASALIGGRWIDKRGTKKIFLLGFISSILGFAICGVGLGYTMILVGKCMIGFGQGLVYVAANAAAGNGTSEEASAKGFADVSAGVLSGITIGVGLGTIVLTIGNYHMVYLIGLIAMLPGLYICYKSKETVVVQQEEEESSEMRLKDFMLSKEVWSFFFLLITPFMIALSFRDYVFPLFVDQFGVSEIRIGQFYLICGVAVLYIGPSLANVVIERFGVKGCSIFSSAMLAISMGVFAVYPSKLTIFIGIAVLYMTICFAYTCQYFSFENMDSVKRYQIGKALGIYSMFENAGQTLGPIVFGMLAVFGMAGGVRIFLIIYVLAFIGFVLLNIRGKKTHD